MMKEYAKHKVKVWTEDKLIPDPKSSASGSLFVLMVPTGETYADWDIEHTEECDNLKYGQDCALDFMLAHSNEGMPDQEGTYLVWVVDNSSFVNNWSHYGWEAELYIDYERIADE